MRMSVHNPQRQHLFTVDVDLAKPERRVKPPHGNGPAVRLDWHEAIGRQGDLRRCPVCACRELYVRKDFPHLVGLAMVVATAAVALFMFASGRVLGGMAVLGGVALTDMLLFPLTNRCLVCYRCRSEFRRVAIPRNHPGWDLATGEKYRLTHASDESA